VVEAVGDPQAAEVGFEDGPQVGEMGFIAMGEGKQSGGFVDHKEVIIRPDWERGGIVLHHRCIVVQGIPRGKFKWLLRHSG
jgi:hypothetical protein